MEELLKKLLQRNSNWDLSDKETIEEIKKLFNSEPPIPSDNRIKEDAFEFSVDYKPFTNDCSPQEYARYGFERGQKELKQRWGKSNTLSEYELDMITRSVADNSPDGKAMEILNNLNNK